MHTERRAVAPLRLRHHDDRLVQAAYTVGLGIIGTAMIRAMTFNVRYGEAEDGANAWPQRRGFVFETIGSHDPDLVGLQEPNPQQCLEIASALGEGWTGIFGDRLDPAHPDDHGKAVFYRTSRFAEKDRGVFWISETPRIAGSILEPNQWGERTGAWVKLSDRSCLRELVFCCTHFDTHPGCSLRAAEIFGRELAVVASELPTIAVGDFNTPAGSPAYRYLTETAGFRDTWREAGLPDTGVISFNGWTMADRQPTDPRTLEAYLEAKYESDDFGAHHIEEYRRLRNERMDWILVSGSLACGPATIDVMRRSGRYASDHFAVIADVDWSAS